ncbi:hypothetical protein GRI97_09515 [Altererythrobacter xixiisoli]|uniref:Uncharacterized protein n=1 Tax=Croceibacterium xixiisoli TaxID=1476466 RepID=A0A6I4TSV3_9SPHN|nr:hypothetical protein [Croceibacterium xixiisoli]MXO99225.1 hypothetical protein [Croceibacterium xixiisoli]
MSHCTHHFVASADQGSSAITAANGCDQPCPYGNFYHCCIVTGPHDGPHFCDQGHSW